MGVGGPDSEVEEGLAVQKRERAEALPAACALAFVGATQQLLLALPDGDLQLAQADDDGAQVVSLVSGGHGDGASPSPKKRKKTHRRAQAR